MQVEEEEEEEEDDEEEEEEAKAAGEVEDGSEQPVLTNVEEDTAQNVHEDNAVPADPAGTAPGGRRASKASSRGRNA